MSSSSVLDTIPVLDLDPEIDELWDDVQAAIARVLRSSQFIMGPEVRAFEREVAEYLGVQHALGVNSGTDALVIALRALGIGPGDEVITSPFTFFATAESISIIGATPVFVDVCAADFNLDPEAVEAAITERTRAIMPVHLYGQPAAMTQLMVLAERYDLRVVEDCAQSFGARYEGDCPGCGGAHCDDARRAALTGRQTGTLGEVGAFSFFPSKNLGAFGDAGLIATDDDAVAEAAGMLRKHGARKKYHNEVLGYNSRLDALQAAVLRVKLPHLDRRNAGRRAAAQRYDQLLADVPGVTLPVSSEGHVFHQYTVRIADGRRDAVQAALKDRGIQTMIYYPIPCHQLPVYSHLNVHLPMAERLAGEVLSLPIWPQITPEIQTRVVGALRDVLTTSA